MNNTMIRVMTIAIMLMILGFMFGWLFPVEGPIDYVYDEAVKKASVKAAPVEHYHLIVNINDLSEEDFEMIQEVFRNKKGEQ